MAHVSEITLREISGGKRFFHFVYAKRVCSRMICLTRIAHITVWLLGVIGHVRASLLDSSNWPHVGEPIIAWCHEIQTFMTCIYSSLLFLTHISLLGMLLWIEIFNSIMYYVFHLMRPPPLPSCLLLLKLLSREHHSQLLSSAPSMPSLSSFQGIARSMSLNKLFPRIEIRSGYTLLRPLTLQIHYHCLIVWCLFHLGHLLDDNFGRL